MSVSAGVEMCTGVGVGTYPPKPADILVGMGKSFSLDPRSWRVWLRHFTVMGFSPIPVSLRKPATGIVPIVFAYAVQCRGQEM